jgi:single-strand DNA-binding protein
MDTRRKVYVEVEVTHRPDGTARPNIIKFENGEKSASFIPCVAFGKTAEAIGNYVSKADRLLVEGSLNTRSYDDKTGQKRYVTEVLVNRMDFIERKEKSAPSSNSANEGGFETMGAIEDIPF